jgi:subtilisin family serine protease
MVTLTSATWEVRVKHHLSKSCMKGWGIVSTLALLLSASGSSLAQSPAASPAPMRSVTLITGDRVTISGQGGLGKGGQAVSVQRGPGRERVRVVTQNVALSGQGSHLYVIPEDAAPLIASGKVDRRLFDVTLLLEFGYDDAHRRDLPFIVTYARQGSAVAAAPRTVAGAVADRNLPSVNGQSMRAPKASVGQVWSSMLAGRAPGGAARSAAGEPIGAIWLDGLLKPVLDKSVAQIGAPEAWALGYEGDGVVVGVLDTGVDETHPDLADSVIVSRNFTETVDADTIGHGTHVASIIAGSGAASDGRYRGVAPGAQLLAAKVCEDFGCSESSIIAGAQWVVAEEGARVVNVSLSGGDTPGYDPMEEAVSTLTAQYGALFVIAAGNSGPSGASIGSPGSVAAALTVGAVDRDEQVAFFSSRGLTLDGAIKPDLTAPGVDIVAARAAGTELGTLVGEDYATAGGTSMATPHVAGAAALLVQRHPVWSAADLKAALVGAAEYNPAFTALDQGTGRVDVPAALEASLLASTASLSFGLAPWPHEDDLPVTRSVTYRNLGAEAELAFELDVSGVDGAPAPEGMFDVEPSTLTIPAGGTAAVKVTGNPAAGSIDGVFGGRLIATDGAGRTQVVSIALQRETESYDVVFRYLDHEGQPANGSGLLLGGEPPIFAFMDASPDLPDTTLRLPRGQYILESWVYEPLPEPEPERGNTVVFTVLLAPDLSITGDTVVDIDARTSVPVDLTLPIAGTTLDNTTLSYDAATPTASLSSTIGFGGGSPVYYSGLIGSPSPDLRASLQGVWSTEGSPDVYTSAWFSDGTLPAGEFVVDTSQLAKVHATYAGYVGNTPITETTLGIAAYRVGSGGYGYSSPYVDFPLERNEYYYSTDDELRWITSIWANDESFSQYYFLDGSPSAFEVGRDYEVRFNAPIHVATIVDERVFGIPAAREGDSLAIFPPIYGDSDAHEGYVPTTGRTRLYRNGELFAEVEAGDGGRFDVPPELATYRVEIDTAQSLFELTTQQRLVWTFESETHPAEEPVALPLLTVRFDASLDDQGRAPRGHFCLPFRIAQLGRQRPKGVKVTVVEASYDDGATWAPASVEQDGRSWNAFLEHPASSDYASLRIRAEDRAGNSVEQTVIRAYGLAAAP